MFSFALFEELFVFNFLDFFPIKPFVVDVIRLKIIKVAMKKEGTRKVDRETGE